jgi:hypothetical protein
VQAAHTGAMRARPFLGAAVVVLVVTASSCSSPSHQGANSGPRTGRTSTTTAAQSGASTTLPSGALTAAATVSPDQGVVGTSFTFTVTIRGAGTLDEESVKFGDGGTSGANAGLITCGGTAQADHTSTYPHQYTVPGTYSFSDEVLVLGPPPTCQRTQATATVRIVVAAPLSAATANGAFLSPSKNIACLIYAPEGHDLVRCASFSPPLLATMDASGTTQTCTVQCELGNPAPDTPVLPYGSATGDGTFQCLSTTARMTCTIVGHIGFRISRSGIEQIR